MIIVMSGRASEGDVAQVVARIEELGLSPHISAGSERTLVGVIGDDRPVDPETFRALDGVDKVLPVLAPYRLASHGLTDTTTVIDAGGVPFGGTDVIVMAGPCSIESRDQAMRIAEQLAALGVPVFRGGAFKPRTSPYSFQGMGEAGLEILAEIRDTYGMAVITEVMGAGEVEIVASHADILQIGTRNMQNYRLLEAVGEVRTPALVKRGMSSTIEELLLAAEYILAGGNHSVMVCERGIRTFEPSTRATFDVNAVPVLHSQTHLPVVVDPSHATGRADIIPDVSLAAIAAGADALLIEVHDEPERAMSDGAQSLRPPEFARFMERAVRVAAAVDRGILRRGTT